MLLLNKLLEAWQRGSAMDCVGFFPSCSKTTSWHRGIFLETSLESRCVKYSYHSYIWLLKYGSCWTEVASYGTVEGSERTCEFGGFWRLECVVEKFFFWFVFTRLNICIFMVIWNCTHSSENYSFCNVWCLKWYPRLISSSGKMYAL